MYQKKKGTRFHNSVSFTQKIFLKQAENNLQKRWDAPFKKYKKGL